MQVPFVPSLFVEIRKSMGQEVFEVFHGAVVDAVERERSKSKASRSDDPDDTDPSAFPSGVKPMCIRCQQLFQFNLDCLVYQLLGSHSQHLCQRI
ncbi:MAG: hypothetical protein ACE1ZM_09120 [Gammaproteobacteria bacterium]